MAVADVFEAARRRRMRVAPAHNRVELGRCRRRGADTNFRTQPGKPCRHALVEPEHAAVVTLAFHGDVELVERDAKLRCAHGDHGTGARRKRRPHQPARAWHATTAADAFRHVAFNGFAAFAAH